MVKDEDVCLHCGLCAERCPTSAWDMQKFLYTITKAGDTPAPILVEQTTSKDTQSKEQAA